MKGQFHGGQYRKHMNFIQSMAGFYSFSWEMMITAGILDNFAVFYPQIPDPSGIQGAISKSVRQALMLPVRHAIINGVKPSPGTHGHGWLFWDGYGWNPDFRYSLFLWDLNDLL